MVECLIRIHPERSVGRYLVAIRAAFPYNHSRGFFILYSQAATHMGLADGLPQVPTMDVAKFLTLDCDAPLARLIAQAPQNFFIYATNSSGLMCIIRSYSIFELQTANKVCIRCAQRLPPPFSGRVWIIRAISI